MCDCVIVCIESSINYFASPHPPLAHAQPSIYSLADHRSTFIIEGN